ncbi:MAG: PIN domain-containing protein [Anaerolineae bacterium]|nr:PIN domain-containing protein [Anaerolineae bacterium]
MAQPIFWDAWAFIALGDRKYRYHPDAEAIRQRLQQSSDYLITTEAVLTEVGNAFSKSPLRLLGLQQIAFVNDMVSKNRAKVVTVDTRLWKRAWALYQQRPDKDWGHTDCISFVVMQELGLTTAFTADVHFEQAGFIRLVKI